MKLTATQLRKIIREELNEAGGYELASGYRGSAMELGRIDFLRGYMVFTGYTNPDKEKQIGITIGDGYDEAELYLSEDEFSDLKRYINRVDPNKM